MTNIKPYLEQVCETLAVLLDTGFSLNDAYVRVFPDRITISIHADFVTSELVDKAYRLWYRFEDEGEYYKVITIPSNRYEQQAMGLSKYGHVLKHIDEINFVI